MDKLQLFYPVKPLHINQPFGNPDPTYTNMGMKGHNGIDYMAYHGQPVYAAHDGYAVYEIDEGGGHGVVVRSNQPFLLADGSSNYIKTIYWHFCDQIKEPKFTSPITNTDPYGNGQPVKTGDLLGYADNTGVTTGDHLHFGMKRIAPGESNGAWSNLNQTNGYFGAEDPTPYMNGSFAVDAQRVTLIKKLISLYQQLAVLLFPPKI